MQFAFTEEQELLRREARDAFANGGWSREEIMASLAAVLPVKFASS